MHQPQPGILADLPAQARYLSFSLNPAATPQQLRRRLEELEIDQQLVVALGTSLVTTLGLEVAPLRPFPAIASRIDIPSTPSALWCWLRGDERGELLHRTRQLQQQLAPALTLEACVDGFRYREGRDLTGYEDGTENPTGDAALQAALVSDGALAHSSFVAVQRWQHDMHAFAAMARSEQDHSIGRRRSDNQELDDAPPAAHVKRTAQESFSPEAFLLRRSMPWNDASAEGLMFVAFGHSFTAFEQQLERMCGLEDGIEDALFRFTRPRSGAYFWCPPVRGARLALEVATGA